MATIWRSYLRVLTKYPLATMCSTTGTLMAAGDGISQLAIENNPLRKYDLSRSGRFFVLGFCVIGPMMRFWYLALDKMYSGTRYAALKMVVTDQTFGAPVVLFTFVAGMGVLRGDSRQQIMENIDRDYFAILLNNYKVFSPVGPWMYVRVLVSDCCLFAGLTVFWLLGLVCMFFYQTVVGLEKFLWFLMIWPAAQAINFFFMPLQHRVLFVNFVALGWNTFLAWVTEGKTRAEQE